MKEINKLDQLSILNKAYITINDIYKVLPIGKNYASKIFREIEDELREKGKPLFITRPRVVPTEYLVKRFPELKKLKKGQ